MLTRKCAGGVVFQDDRVMILKSDKNEWVLPKGVIRGGDIAIDVALQRVKLEGGVEARVISSAGETSYEFYSYSRRRPVCNKIDWFIMESNSTEVAAYTGEGFSDGGFFPIEEALQKITYSQDKSLVRLAYRKYCNLRHEETAVSAG